MQILSFESSISRPPTLKVSPPALGHKNRIRLPTGLRVLALSELIDGKRVPTKPWFAVSLCRFSRFIHIFGSKVFSYHIKVSPGPAPLVHRDRDDDWNDGSSLWIKFIIMIRHLSSLSRLSVGGMWRDVSMPRWYNLNGVSICKTLFQLYHLAKVWSIT